MALTPKELRKKEAESERTGMKVPWVPWLAIGLGVTMTGIGLLLLLWGLTWQTDVGEPQAINGDDLKGGPCLIPIGGGMATVGILWIMTGWRGFKKDRTMEDVKRCPHCGKMIESDLSFCYYCNTTFEDESKDDESGKIQDMKKEQEGAEPRRKAKPFSPEEKP